MKSTSERAFMALQKSCLGNSLSTHRKAQNCPWSQHQKSLVMSCLGKRSLRLIGSCNVVGLLCAHPWRRHNCRDAGGSRLLHGLANNSGNSWLSVGLSVALWVAHRLLPAATLPDPTAVYTNTCTNQTTETGNNHEHQEDQAFIVVFATLATLLALSVSTGATCIRVVITAFNRKLSTCPLSLALRACTFFLFAPGNAILASPSIRAGAPMV